MGYFSLVSVFDSFPETIAMKLMYESPGTESSP